MITPEEVQAQFPAIAELLEDRSCISEYSRNGLTVSIGWRQDAPGHAILVALVICPEGHGIDRLSYEETLHVTRTAYEVDGRHAFEMYASIYHDMIN
jgi:hypothetical protein